MNAGVRDGMDDLENDGVIARRPGLLARTVLAGMTALVLGACAADGGSGGGAALTVTGAWARPALAGGNAAVYLTIHNGADAPDRLISVGVAVAGSAEVHETVMEGNLARMVPRSNGIDVAAGEDAVFEPGGTHIMLVGLADDLVLGETIPLTLDFEQAGAVVVEAEVRQDGAGGAHGTEGHP